MREGERKVGLMEGIELSHDWSNEIKSETYEKEAHVDGKSAHVESGFPNVCAEIMDCR